MSGLEIDLDQIVAIDVHAHVHRSVDHAHVDQDGNEAMGEYFGIGTMPTYSVPELAAYYRERKMAAVVFTVDTVSQSGADPEPPNEEIARLAAENSDVLIPFASIDPARGKLGVEQAERLINEYGVRGFKFHPSAQGFYPNDHSAYPLYEVIAAHGLIALFHTGQTGVGAGQPGGGGIRLKYANPMLIDLSGWSPKYFPPQLVQYANTLLRHKMLFGSDFPVITPDRWLSDFSKLPIKPEVVPMILKDNAARLFGLSTSAPSPNEVH
jgi:uncharacterized protein